MKKREPTGKWWEPTGKKREPTGKMWEPPWRGRQPTGKGWQLMLLVGRLARHGQWPALGAATGMALLAMAPALGGAPAPATQVWGLRIAALILGATAGLAVIEPMSALAVTPTPRWLRQWSRVVVGVLPAVVIWPVLYVVARAGLPGDAGPGALPLGDMAAEALVCCLSGPAGAAVAARYGPGLSLAIAGPAAQAALVSGSLFVAGDMSPWLLPSAPHWEAVHDGWRLAAVAVVVVLAVANREPRFRTRARAEAVAHAS